MSLKVEFNNPDFPKGLEYDLGGFLVPNGGSVELSEDQENAFVARHQKSVKDALKSSQVKVTGSSLLGKSEGSEA